MGYGNDRTFTAQQWRVVVSVACGILVAGVGLGVLIGRMTASPEPPPATATILSDVLPAQAATTPAPAPPSDEDTEEPTSAAPAPVAAAPSPPPPPAPAPIKATPPPPAPVQTAAAPKPERPASPPKHVEAKPKPEPAKPASVKSVSTEAEPEPGAPRWVVQLGAFQSSDHANLLVNTLAAHGQPAHVTYGQNAAGQGLFYVQTPPYRSAAAAKSAAQGLAAREHLPTYLVKLPPTG